MAGRPLIHTQIRPRLRRNVKKKDLNAFLIIHNEVEKNKTRCVNIIFLDSMQFDLKYDYEVIFI